MREHFGIGFSILGWSRLQSIIAYLSDLIAVKLIYGVVARLRKATDLRSVSMKIRHVEA
jgi:hypothetical protein